MLLEVAEIAIFWFLFINGTTYVGNHLLGVKIALTDKENIRYVNTE